MWVASPAVVNDANRHPHVSFSKRRPILRVQQGNLTNRSRVPQQHGFIARYPLRWKTDVEYDDSNAQVIEINR